MVVTAPTGQPLNRVGLPQSDSLNQTPLQKVQHQGPSPLWLVRLRLVCPLRHQCQARGRRGCNGRGGTLLAQMTVRGCLVATLPSPEMREDRSKSRHSCRVNSWYQWHEFGLITSKNQSSRRQKEGIGTKGGSDNSAQSRLQEQKAMVSGGLGTNVGCSLLHSASFLL